MGIAQSGNTCCERAWRVSPGLAHAPCAPYSAHTGGFLRERKGDAGRQTQQWLKMEWLLARSPRHTCPSRQAAIETQATSPQCELARHASDVSALVVGAPYKSNFGGAAAGASFLAKTDDQTWLAGQGHAMLRGETQQLQETLAADPAAPLPRTRTTVALPAAFFCDFATTCMKALAPFAAIFELSTIALAFSIPFAPIAHAACSAPHMAVRSRSLAPMIALPRNPRASAVLHSRLCSTRRQSK